MTRIFIPKKNDYKGVVYVNGKPISVSDHKLGGYNYLTTQEERKLNEYINHYKL